MSWRIRGVRTARELMTNTTSFTREFSRTFLRIRGICTRIFANLSCIREVWSRILTSSRRLRRVNTRKRANSRRILADLLWVLAYSRIHHDHAKFALAYLQIHHAHAVCTRIQANLFGINTRILYNLCNEFLSLFMMNFGEFNVYSWWKWVEVLLGK